jgi:Flp pilus assembly pilin Flp
MLTGTRNLAMSPASPLSATSFLAEVTGASMYEFALLASLVAVVSIIILIALNLGL